MTALIRPAEVDDIEAICTFLQTKMNAAIPIERWRRLMTYEWLKVKPDVGRVVDEGGHIKGFVGLIYADRRVSGPESGTRTERIANLSSWYLDKSLRGSGLGRELMVETVANPAYTYTGFTNSKKPLAIFESVGFQVLDDHRYLWHKAGKVDPTLVTISEPDAIRVRVEQHEVKLLDDMATEPVVPLLLDTVDGQSLLFFSIKLKGTEVTWYDLLHIGNPALFVHYAQRLADLLLPDSTAVMAADSRLIPDAPASVKRMRMSVSRYFISDRVVPRDIDLLYSELQLMDFKLE